MGSLEQITSYARHLGLDVEHVHLGEQFRCGGSEEYLLWVQCLLGLGDDSPTPWRTDPQFAVTVADSPEELESLLRRELDEGYSARMSAGYCWPWSDHRMTHCCTRMAQS